MKFLIVTCNKTKHILPAFDRQFEKYVDSGIFERHIIDLGDEPVATWTQNVYKRIKDIEDEFVVLSLDDYLIIDWFDECVFRDVLCEMYADETIGRYELGFGGGRKANIHTEGLPYYKYDQNMQYRVSCQISVWRTSYLLSFLLQNWSIWDFEVKGSKMSNHDGMEVVATKENYALRWIEESALSARHPGRVNLLGMRISDVYDLVDNGIVDKNSVQFGMAKGGDYEVGMLDVLGIGNKYKRFYL
jgi:hypothetical protein